MVESLSLDSSDHCAGLLKIQISIQPKKGSFKIFNFLIKHRDFLQKVRDLWTTTIVQGLRMYRLSKKLKALKPMLRNFSKIHFQGIHKRVEEAREELLKLQRALLTSLSVNLIVAKQTQGQRLHELLDAEESFLKQKARVEWIKEVEQNTNYFHIVIKGKVARCKITKLTTDDGSVITDDLLIKREILN